MKGVKKKKYDTMKDPEKITLYPNYKPSSALRKYQAKAYYEGWSQNK